MDHHAGAEVAQKGNIVRGGRRNDSDTRATGELDSKRANTPGSSVNDDRLARIEARVLFDELLQRFSTIELAGDPKRLRSSLMRSLVHLPVAVG